MRVLLLSALLTASCSGQVIGAWRVNAGRSTFVGDSQPKSFIVRIEPHAKGEVLTFDRVEADGRTTSASTILYLDEKPRGFQDFGCSGTQSSRRMDSRTVEILRNCGAGAWTKYVCRASAKPNELVLEVIEQHADGRRFERRLTLEKQKEKQ
jgi:hypothetical protein